MPLVTSDTIRRWFEDNCDRLQIARNLDWPNEEHRFEMAATAARRVYRLMQNSGGERE